MGKISKPNIKATLKRKVGYINEDVSIRRAKLTQMKIAEDKEGDNDRSSNTTK
jgi:hypothetical protein